MNCIRARFDSRTEAIKNHHTHPRKVRFIVVEAVKEMSRYVSGRIRSNHIRVGHVYASSEHHQFLHEIHHRPAW
jgi:mannose/fructose/N-acetylgalactosamine-specific phosphotransferase system component IIB